MFADLDIVKKSKYRIVKSTTGSCDILIPNVSILYKNHKYIFGDITIRLSLRLGPSFSISIIRCDRGHPHINGSAICLGDGNLLIQQFLYQYSVSEKLYIMPILLVLEEILSTYGNKPFYQIELFKNNGNYCAVCSKYTACVARVYDNDSLHICADCIKFCELIESDSVKFYLPEALIKCKTCGENMLVADNICRICTPIFDHPRPQRLNTIIHNEEEEDDDYGDDYDDDYDDYYDDDLDDTPF